MEKKKKLNARQKKFCLLRASGLKQIDAFRKAGFKGGYSRASDLEAREQIGNEIGRLQLRAEEKSFDLKKTCQNLAPEIIEELLIVAKGWNLKGSNSDKVSAARELLDRGFGKPTEKIDLEVHKILLE
jgi:phage terminase small subunit